MTAQDLLDRPTIAQLRDRFAPAFALIREGSIGREQDRDLPFAAVAELRDTGFGTLRVPIEHGGLGASLSQLFALLIDLGAADSNLPQLLRGHFAFVEGRLNARDHDAQSRWFELVSSGVLFGNAQAERGAETSSNTRLTRDGSGFLLNGAKYYSTGTLFADWIWATASLDDDHVGVALPADRAGVTRLDDWDGFGQRLTGSGTTRFDDAAVGDDEVIHFSPDDSRAHANITAFYQLVLLATLAGIGRRVREDAVEFVIPRTRTFGVPGASSPRTDPLVQQVVGRLSARASAAERIVLSVANELDEVHESWLVGEAEQDAFDRVEIAAFEAQATVIPLVLDSVTELFEVGGASATSEDRRLDRHWRNARTIASHNPLIYRERAVGDYHLNGASPTANWAARRTEKS
ncbi:acyl-CoA dehydrogenase family protein [Rathayibacter sp. CAU 1779]